MNKKDLKFNKAINNITIDSNIDLRSVYDDGINYINNNNQSLFISQSAIYKCIVNNLRHNNTNYEKEIRKINKMYHYDLLRYIQYKNAVLDKIGSKYPSLKNECDKQKRKLNIVEYL